MSEVKEIARKVWHGAATIYGTKIATNQVDQLFEKWWKRNGVEEPAIPSKISISRR